MNNKLEGYNRLGVRSNATGFYRQQTFDNIDPSMLQPMMENTNMTADYPNLGAPQATFVRSLIPNTVSDPINPLSFIDGYVQAILTFLGSNFLDANNHFKLIFTLGTVSVYLSDGTTPNAVLTANKGSICLFTSATGQMAYNTNGGTGWTLL